MKIIIKFIYAAVAVVILAIVITTSASGQGVNDRYYRLEEGVAGNCASGAGSIVDSYFGSPDGTPDGCPVYSTDVPLAAVPTTGAPKKFFLKFQRAHTNRVQSF